MFLAGISADLDTLLTFAEFSKLFMAKIVVKTPHEY